MSLGFVRGVSVSRAVCLIVVSCTPFPIYGKLKAYVEARWIQSTPVPPPTPPPPTSSKKLEKSFS